MRALFLLLVLANAAFFAWSRYVSPLDSAVDPAPLGRQIEPQKLKVVSLVDLPAASPAKPAATPAPPVSLKCMEWGSFALADAPRAEKALEPLSLGARLTQRKTEETAGWWVFIPPQADGRNAGRNARQGALRKASELKGLGVSDYFIVQEEGPHRWAVSLGVFRTEEAAQARLAALRQQGVRSALVGARETQVPKVWLQVKGVDPALEARLKEIALAIEGSELRACPSQ